MSESLFSGEGAPQDGNVAGERVSEQELVLRALSGEESSVEVLVREQFPRVYSVAYAHLRDREAAEDLAQEVFLRAHIHLPELKEPGRFSHWLVRVARNLALTWRRDGQRASKLVSMVPLDEQALNRAATAGKSPREQLDRAQQDELVRQAVEQLPAELREVVVLHYAEGLSKSEIARTLDSVSVGAIGFSNSVRELEIRNGETINLQDVLFEGGSIRWLLTDSRRQPVQDIPVRIIPQEADSIEAPREGKTDKNGVLLVSGLMPGTYTGTAQPEGRPAITATFQVRAHDVAERMDMMD